MTKVIFVVGPTASGKSALALELAAEFGGHILNCDSLQACQRLDVGSAKPTIAERARVPHHLFDVVAPGERFTAGDFRRRALAALARIDAPVFAVGGSGFYIRALEKGMFGVDPPSPAVEAGVRARLASLGPQRLYDELLARDPEYARRLSANDTYRVTRALVMMDDSGRSVTDLRASFRGEALPYPTLKLGLNPDLETLAARIERRTRDMLASGLIAETRALVNEGFAAWPALASVGYLECAQALRGEITEDELPARIAQKTRALAKKQRTWFKRDGEIYWLDEGTALARARDLVRRFIDPSDDPS